ncbi:hypothetical protein MMC07_007287 [Pseudocyphellaria aurata]|nr:hypothetical protein [Pseudocyphellaria aurata]
MSRGTLRFVSLLAFTFSAALCFPQSSSQAYHDIQNGQDSSTSTGDVYNVAYLSTPGNFEFIPGIREQNYVDTAALQDNTPETIHPTDTTPGPRLDTFDSMLSTDRILWQVQICIADSSKDPSGKADRIDSHDISDPRLHVANTLLAQKSPAQVDDQYLPEDCLEGTQWACCNRKIEKKKPKQVCKWLFTVQKGNYRDCDTITCCSADGDKPDQSCPNISPKQQLINSWNEFIDWWGSPDNSGGGDGAGIGGLGGAGLGGLGGLGGAWGDP